MNSREPDERIEAGHIFQIQRIAWHEYRTMPDYVRHRSDERMRMSIAEFIKEHKIETLNITDAEKTGYVDRRLDLYVFSPAEIYSLINAKVEELYWRYRPIDLGPPR